VMTDSVAASSDRGDGGKKKAQTDDDCGRRPSILPKVIVDHYSRHGVDGIEEYLDLASAEGGYRFVRLNPRYPREETLSILRQEILECTSQSQTDFPITVSWLNDKLAFYAIPASFALAKSKSFQSGRVYGMDISSGAAVAALLFEDHDCSNTGRIARTKEESSTISAASSAMRVLDLCCSPGLKLCAIADCLRDVAESTVVGVDVNESRMSLCRRIVKKYQIDRQTSGRNINSDGCDGNRRTAVAGNDVRIRLYCEDGCKFGTKRCSSLFFDSEVALEDAQVAGKRKRMNKSARARQQKRLRAVAHLDFIDAQDSDDAAESHCFDDSITDRTASVIMHPFDRVLVDAECSTDGALKHLKHKVKHQSNGAVVDETALSMSGISKLGDANALSELIKLQKRLIFSGFRLLKRGGILVYSTCSLSGAQNEGVVNWLLQQCADSYTIPVSFSRGGEGLEEDSVLISEGSIPGTVRFRPMLKDNSSDGTNTASRLTGGGFWLAKIGKK